MCECLQSASIHNCFEIEAIGDNKRINKTLNPLQRHTHNETKRERERESMCVYKEKRDKSEEGDMLQRREKEDKEDKEEKGRMSISNGLVFSLSYSCLSRSYFLSNWVRFGPWSLSSFSKHCPSVIQAVLSFILTYPPTPLFRFHVLYTCNTR